MFDLKNIEIFDKTSQSYLKYTIGCASGMIIGYSIDADSNFDIDVTRVKVDKFYRKDDIPENFDYLKTIFSSAEWKLVNPSDIYEIELDNRIYYHLMDLEDGDFIGIDQEKHVYKITHDPFGIKLLDKSLIQLLKKDQ